MSVGSSGQQRSSFLVCSSHSRQHNNINQNFFANQPHPPPPPSVARALASGEQNIAPGPNSPRVRNRSSSASSRPGRASAVKPRFHYNQQASTPRTGHIQTVNYDNLVVENASSSEQNFDHGNFETGQYATIDIPGDRKNGSDSSEYDEYTVDENERHEFMSPTNITPSTEVETNGGDEEDEEADEEEYFFDDQLN